MQIQALLVSKAEVIVLTRPSSTTAQSLPEAATVISLDYADKSAVEAALRKHQVEVVISTVKPGPAIEIQIPLADASKAAGVKLFVPSEFGLVPAKGPKEKVIEHLKSIGLPSASYFVRN
jgi:uncharacterized protein YbjT (DUF2867 family)